ncbi:nuclear transport factor 2 family protein [Pseudomonas eucalypticola]|uniref:Nuclear transport factor 2 family protein n=2 Tax=Pseudomonas TaxID=286 RepID=A0A7D5HI02_9PSED|nr:nuclear transport factor 2 family protein [Pseudomonas eucalypticola]QKZ05766.1 nuclear transport factor 2 family protein [Pseudomonas eucalypticola]
MLDDHALTATLRALEDQRYHAMRQGDLETFAHLAHPDLVYVHSNGVQDTLARYLAKCRDGLYRYHRIDHQVHEVRRAGDTALAFGEMWADITSHGVAKTLHNRTLSVWLDTAEGWRLLAYQPTPVVQRPAPAATQGDLPHVNAPIRL